MDRWDAGARRRGLTFKYIELNNVVGPSELPRFRRKYVFGRSRPDLSRNWSAFYGDSFGRCTLTSYGGPFAFISNLSETATIMPTRKPETIFKNNETKICSCKKEEVMPAPKPIKNVRTYSSKASSYNKEEIMQAPKPDGNTKIKEIKTSSCKQEEFMPALKRVGKGKNIDNKTNIEKTSSEKPVLNPVVKNLPIAKYTRSKKVSKNVVIRCNEAVRLANELAKSTDKNSSLYEANLLGLPQEKYLIWRYRCPLTAMRHLKEKEKEKEIAKKLSDTYSALENAIAMTNEKMSLNNNFDNIAEKPKRKNLRKVSFSPVVSVIHGNGGHSRRPLCDWDKITSIDFIRRKNGVIPKVLNMHL